MWWRRKRDDGWEPLPQNDSPDLEAIREIAQELVGYWDFHELAISDPFKAESYVRGVGNRLVELVGWPEGYRMYTVPDSSQSTRETV